MKTRIKVTLHPATNQFISALILVTPHSLIHHLQMSMNEILTCLSWVFPRHLTSKWTSLCCYKPQMMLLQPKCDGLIGLCWRCVEHLSFLWLCLVFESFGEDSISIQQVVSVSLIHRRKNQHIGSTMYIQAENKSVMSSSLLSLWSDQLVTSLLFSILTANCLFIV